MTIQYLNQYESVEIVDIETAKEESGFSSLAPAGVYARFTKVHPIDNTVEVFIAEQKQLHLQCNNCAGTGVIVDAEDGDKEKACPFCDNSSGYVKFRKPYWQPL